jgi:hypothetical protein
VPVPGNDSASGTRTHCQSLTNIAGEWGHFQDSSGHEDNLIWWWWFVTSPFCLEDAFALQQGQLLFQFKICKVAKVKCYFHNRQWPYSGTSSTTITRSA